MARLVAPSIGSAAALFALIFATRAAAQTAHGFFDQGFLRTPVIRTDLSSPTEGTAANPLQISACHFGQNPCPPLHAIFAQSNFWSQNYPMSCTPGLDCPDGWWTLVLNNEPADSTQNIGPPDVSLPRAAPGAGLMGFNALHGSDNFPGDTSWRAHLVLNMGYANPIAGAIPFLGFGTFLDHGNPWPIGSLNPSDANVPSVLKFSARLWEYALPDPCCGPGTTQLQTLTSWLQITAQWGSHARLVQIAIWHIARDPQHPDIADPYLGGTPPNNYDVPFEWRYSNSAFHPGALLLTITAEALHGYCAIDLPTLVEGRDVSYSVDMQRLFRCLDDHHLFDEPLPSTPNIPVISVVWANEGSGINGGLWTDVHAMRVTGADEVFTEGFEGGNGAAVQRMPAGNRSASNPIQAIEAAIGDTWRVTR